MLAEMAGWANTLQDLLSSSEIVRFEVIDAQRVDYQYKFQNPDLSNLASKVDLDFATAVTSSTGHSMVSFGKTNSATTTTPSRAPAMMSRGDSPNPPGEKQHEACCYFNRRTFRLGWAPPHGPRMTTNVVS